MGAKEAYQMGVQAERNRILALDEMMAVASMVGAENVVAMLAAAKRTGASVEVMSRNMFRAMSRTPRHAGVQGPHILLAIEKPEGNGRHPYISGSASAIVWQLRHGKPGKHYFSCYALWLVFGFYKIGKPLVFPYRVRVRRGLPVGFPDVNPARP